MWRMWMGYKLGSPVRVWVVPALYILFALLLGRLIPALDYDAISDRASELIFSQEVAISILSAIFTGMVTFTGLVFSLTFILVQFTTSAYSPRVASYFLQDRVVDNALGVFIATFLYALIALMHLDLAQEGIARDMTVLVAALLLLASTIMFLALVQRVTSLQITSVLRMIGQIGRREIRELYPPLEQDLESGAATAGSSGSVIPAELPPVTQVVVHHGGPAVVGELDVRGLVHQASRAGALIEVGYAVGDTLVEGAELLRVRGQQESIPEGSLRRAVIVAEQRTIDQDPKYALRLLVDIAIRALSPAVNDPTTTVQALNQIEDLLRRLARSQLSVGYSTDSDGRLRVIFPTPNWADFLALAIDEIRLYGARSMQVMRRLRALLNDLEAIAPPERQEAVRHHLARVEHSIDRSFFDFEDRAEALQPDRQGIGLSRQEHDLHYPEPPGDGLNLKNSAP